MTMACLIRTIPPWHRHRSAACCTPHQLIGAIELHVSYCQYLAFMHQSKPLSRSFQRLNISLPLHAILVSLCRAMISAPCRERCHENCRERYRVKHHDNITVINSYSMPNSCPKMSACSVHVPGVKFAPCTR
jgi:hypothetical protein